MLELRIQQHFIDSADLNYQAAQALGKPIAAAVQALLACVTAGGKVLACGSGRSAALAQAFAVQFVVRYERERPELAAIALGADAATLSALARDHGASALFARSLRAVAAPGDVLLALCVDGRDAAVQAAVQAAHERDMTVVALTGAGSGAGSSAGGALADLLRDTDVHICVPSDRAARIHEVHLLALHCIVDAVDTQLLGEQELPS